MYDSLNAADEPDIRILMTQGYTEDDALHEIFKRKFVYNHNFVRGQQPVGVGSPPVQQGRQQTQQYQPYNDNWDNNVSIVYVVHVVYV